jgi:hypothetical protein
VLLPRGKRGSHAGGVATGRALHVGDVAMLLHDHLPGCGYHVGKRCGYTLLEAACLGPLTHLGYWKLEWIVISRLYLSTYPDLGRWTTSDRKGWVG